ncbi:MAG: two component sensor kinase [Rhizobium sp.]|nr:two component sensor kinase [Rhizobium sp.]
MKPLALLNSGGWRARRYGRVGIAIAPVLAACVFYVDTFTEIHSAIAVFYVIVLLLAGDALTERGILLLSGFCTALATFSYGFAHGLDPDLAAALRLVVSIAALLITCALIIRNQRARTELLKFNAALQRSETRYRTIFEQSRVALWERDYSAVRDHLMSLKANGVTDLREYARRDRAFTGRCIALVPVIAANAAALELLGNVSPQDVSSMRCDIAPDDAAFFDLLTAIFNGETHYEGEGTIIAADGKTKLVLITVGFPDDVATFDRVIVGMIDITEREMTQKALLEAQSALALASRAATVGALSASLAHELNQPLGAVVVNAQTLLRWLRRDPPDLQAAGRSAERIIRDSQRASDIIQNTRSMLSREARTPEEISLIELVHETCALMEHELTRNGISIEIETKPDIRSVIAVRIELQQVLINLISNAIQAMAGVPQGRRCIGISIAENDDGDMISLQIRDSGPGIAEGGMEQLFQPFHSTKPTGLGMGLSISRSTIEAMGGKLAAANHPQGGAIFMITVPRRSVND